MIYYIYKVRRKQTSIRFSRSVLPHRYLRYISWISWVRRPQAATLYKLSFHTEPQSAHTLFSRRCLYHKAAIATPYLCFHLEDKANLSPRRRKTSFFPSLAHLLRAALPALLCPQLVRAASGPSAADPSPAVHVVFCGPPQTKNAGPRHCAANPLKKAQTSRSRKTHVGTPGFHALASAARTYSLTARIHSHSFSFLLFYKEKKKENRSKFSRFEYIARTHFVRPHDVRDWPVAPRPLKFMQQLRPVSYEIASKTSPRWRPRWNEYQSVAGI